jgi:cytochrome c peroxidase
MHDGRFKRLRDVLNHYGGKAQSAVGVDPDVKKIPVLSDKEKTDIVAFLLTLTDKTFLNDRRFIDPFVMQ